MPLASNTIRLITLNNYMTLLEIVARLNLKYKIVKGTIYCIIEDNAYVAYPQVRPASDKEILDIKERNRQQKIDTLLKSYSVKL